MNKMPKIMIIDDNKETLAGLKTFLDGMKFSTVTAENGLDGVKRFLKGKDEFDLIITDLVMPEISGVGVIGMIKKESPSIPIIAITGWGYHPTALAKEAKADLVLEKPVEMEDLYQAIKRLIRQ